VERSIARMIAERKDRAVVKGSLRFVDTEKCELVDAFLTVKGTDIMVAFGKRTEPLVAQKQTAPPSLEISSIVFEEPSGNKALDAGEKATLKVVIKNTGKGSAFGVNLHLSEENLPKGLSFKERVYVGEIKPGEEKNLKVEVVGTEDLPSAEVKLRAYLSEANGFDSNPVLLVFNTKKLEPPVLEIAKIEIVDAQGKKVLRKGVETTITLSVQNRGEGIAKNVYAIMEVRDNNIKLFSDKEVSLGDIMPGEVKKATFKIAIAQRYSGKKVLPISFRIKEERDRFSVSPDIKLTLGEEAPDIKVVKIEPVEVPRLKFSTEDIRNVPVFDKSKLAFGPNDVAIVIGIEQYKNVPKSEYSYDDARLMKAYLLALGFSERNIEFLVDERAGLSEIKKAIEGWLPNRVKPNSRVFVYYSGHGAPDPRTGSAYILPYDGDPNYLELTAYPLKELYQRLGSLKVKEVIVVLDSCFSGAGGRSMIAQGVRPLVLMADTPVVSENMVVFSASTGAQISTSSPDKGHGVFTYYFLKAIKEGKKTLAEIYEYIKPLVEDEARKLNVQQTPKLTPEPDKIKGRFVLLH